MYAKLFMRKQLKSKPGLMITSVASIFGVVTFRRFFARGIWYVRVILLGVCGRCY